jgi:hypothetical protein
VVIQLAAGKVPAASEARSLRLGARAAGVDALLYPSPFKLYDRSEDSRHQPLCRGACIDALAERDERAAALPLVQEHHQMPEISPETVEPPTHDGTHPVPTDVRREFIERGPATLGPADPVVDVLDGLPTLSLGAMPQP